MASEMESKVAELEELLQRSAEMGQMLLGQNEELKQQADTLTAEKQSLQQQLQAQAEEAKELKEAAAARAASRASIARAQRDDGDSSRRFSAMSFDSTRMSLAKLGEHEAPLAQFQEMLEDKEEEVAELQDTIKALEERVQSLTASNSKLKSENSDLQLRVEAEVEKAAKEAKQKEEEQVEGLKVKSMGAKLWDVSARTQKENLQKQADKLLMEREALEAKLHLVEGQSAKLLEELTMERETSQAAQEMLLQKEDEVAGLQESMEVLEQEVMQVKEQLSQAQEKLSEERMKRGADKLRSPTRSAKRTITHALSAQVSIDDEDDDDETHLPTGGSLIQVAEDFEDEVSCIANDLALDSEQEATQKGVFEESWRQSLQEVRSKLLIFFNLDDEVHHEDVQDLAECLNGDAKHHLMEQELTLLRGDISRVLDLSAACRKLLMSVIEAEVRVNCKASMEPECASPRGEEAEARLQQERAANGRLTKEVRVQQTHLQLHKDVKERCEDLCAEVKALRAENARLKLPPGTEELSWYDRFVVAMSCGSRPGRAQGPLSSDAGQKDAAKSSISSLKLEGAEA